MKTAICYYSRHHGNTRKVVQAMAETQPVDLIDVTLQSETDLSGYDLIGFASGIYGFDVSPALVQFIRKKLPPGKRVFFVYTYGGAKGSGVKSARQAALEKGAEILGEFGCKGYDTFGPFRLVGGLAKGHPTSDELQRAREFFRALSERQS